MKKLSLKPNAFDKGEVLTRTQLRKVMGGTNPNDTSVCNDWGNSSYDICYNCCLSWQSTQPQGPNDPGGLTYCDDLCSRNGGGGPVVTT